MFPGEGILHQAEAVDLLPADIITMADMRTTYSREIIELLRNSYGDKLRIFNSTIPQSIRAAETSAEGTLTITVIEMFLSVERPSPVQVTLKQTRLYQYFLQNYTAQQMEEVIVSPLETWSIQHK